MLTIQQINARYGRWMWAAAKRYSTGIWEPEDTFNQLLITCHEACTEGKLAADDSESTQRRWRSFVICRAINIVRGENRRRMQLVGDRDLEIEENREPQPEVVDRTELADNHLRHVTLREAEIVMELAFPSDRTLHRAHQRHAEAVAGRARGELRMNTHRPVVTKADVAATLCVSPATVSRAISRAQQAFVRSPGHATA